MGVMHEAVEDSVGEGRIADDLVPGIDRQLAGDQRRAGAITVLDDLHEVAPLVGREPVWAPVIKDQQIGLGKRAEQTREATVSVGQFEIGKEARHTCVMHRIAITAGFLRQRAAEPRLADTARSGDQQIAMLGNPAAGGQLLEQRLVKPSGGTIVDVLDRRLAVAQLRIAQPALEPLSAAIRRLAIEQQRQLFGRCEIPGSVLRLQFDKGLGHAVEP